MTNETICEMLDEEPRPLHSAAAESIRSLMRHAERAQTVWEKMRDELAKAKAELAQARAKNDACSTCVGSGVMSVLREVLPPDEREVYADEQCAECEGTGIGYVGKLERELAQVKADWRKVYKAAVAAGLSAQSDPRTCPTTAPNVDEWRKGICSQDVEYCGCGWPTPCSPRTRPARRSGHAFSFTTDGPDENGFKFCPYCGGQLRVEKQR